LMACALVASAVSRVLSPPLYGTLSQFQLQRLPKPEQEEGSLPEAAVLPPTSGPIR
jgi:hypothetical protein